jgi:hypothetical protein
MKGQTMSHNVHQIAFFIHVIIGSIALIVFWLPLFAKKGSSKHRLFGNLFVKGMYTVSISGLIMSTLVLIDPIAVRLPEAIMSTEKTNSFILQNRIFAGFLLMLSVLVFSNVRQSIVVLEAKADRSRLKTKFHLSLLVILGLLGITMAVVGFIFEILLFKIFAGLCIANSLAMLYYIFKPSIKKREWIIVHLGNILGAGIGAYTAFFAFGGNRLFADILTGSLMVLPWVLPSIIGVTASIYLTKKYSQQYRVI